MSDQYLVFPGAGEPSTSAHDDAMVVPPLTNQDRSEKLKQYLKSIPDVPVDSDEEYESDITSLVPLRTVGFSAIHPSGSKPQVSELSDSLNNLDQLSFSLERTIASKLDQLDAREIEINEELQEIRKLIEVDKSSYNRNSISCFGMPFFKTSDLRPFPPNEDYISKVRNDELISHDLPSSNFWTSNEITLLQSAVKSEITDRELEKLNLKLMNTISNPEERKKEYQKVWSTLNTKSLPELLTDDSRDFDWHRIATFNFRDRHSPDECRRMWHLYTKPSVRKSHWLKDEDAKLKEIAKENDYQDWDKIAKEMNTGRSGYQCFVQYKRRLAAATRTGRWTPEEDKLLCKIIEQCRIGSYIPWTKVLYYFENRSMRQVFNRWNYSLNPALKKGHFTRSEDFGLCVGVSLYGKNFNKIASILGNRSASQIRERYKSKMNDSKTGSWTKEEDMTLIELFNKYGDKKWSQISKHLARDRTQCRLRYKRLKNKYNFDLDSVKRTVQYKPLHAYEKAWFRQYFTSGKDEKSLRIVSKNLSLIKKRGRKGRSGTQIENQLVDFFLESFCDPNTHCFKNANILDETKLDDAAEVITKLLKLFQANLCFPKNISENYIRSRDTNHLANDTLIKLIMRVAKLYKTEEGTTSYNNFIVDVDNDFAEINELDEKDIAPEKSIDYDPTRFINWKINVERNFEKSYNRASISSLINGDTTEFYVEPLRLDTAGNDPIALPAESIGFSMDQPSSSTSAAETNESPIIIPSKAKTQIDYLVPPSASSMIGLRTYMLARRKLWKMLGKNDVRERLSQPKLLTTTNRRKLSGNEAHDLAISRFTSLLFWPLFLSAHSPSKFGYTKTPETLRTGKISDELLDSDEESDDNTEPEVNLVVKTTETKPETNQKPEKKNSIAYKAKLKAARRRKRTLASENCGADQKSTVFVNCNASGSTSPSKNKPKLSATVTPEIKFSVGRPPKLKRKKEVDPLSSPAAKSTNAIENGKEINTEPQPKVRRKRNVHVPTVVRRSARSVRIKQEPEETDIFD